MNLEWVRIVIFITTFVNLTPFSVIDGLYYVVQF